MTQKTEEELIELAAFGCLEEFRNTPFSDWILAKAVTLEIIKKLKKHKFVIKKEYSQEDIIETFAELEERDSKNKTRKRFRELNYD